MEKPLSLPTKNFTDAIQNTIRKRTERVITQKIFSPKNPFTYHFLLLLPEPRSDIHQKLHDALMNFIGQQAAKVGKRTQKELQEKIEKTLGLGGWQL